MKITSGIKTIVTSGHFDATLSISVTLVSL